jgi:amidase
MTYPTPAFTGPELCSLSAREALALLKSNEISPNDLLTASYKRMDQVEPLINATVTRCDDRARAAIELLPTYALENATNPGWLAGLPIGIKDLTNVKGVATSFGNLALRDFVPNFSDPLVERLEAHGGIIAGKTNTPEFGAGGNTFNDVFGYTRNPWDTRMNAGGSSGGAAASLASGELWLSHGSDLAGSLRTPAAFCGVVGLRPSPGRCGGGPAATVFSIEGLQGPMARDVRDLALFLDAMSGLDLRLPTSLDAPLTSFQSAIEAPAHQIRIAFSEDQAGFAPVDQEIRLVLRKAMERVEMDGISVDIACPDLAGLYETYTTLRGMHYGSVTAYLPAKVQKHYDALRQRTIIFNQMYGFLTRFDVLAIPVTGAIPGPVEVEFPASVDNEPVSDYLDWLRFSFLATTAGLPALSLPVGYTSQGLPVGLQLVGPPRGEARLLQVAAKIEEILAISKKPIDPIISS